MPKTDISASFAGSIGDANVKGRVLAPGTWTVFVQGQPTKVRFSKDVILDAYKRLKARVAARAAEMRLMHPNLGDMPIRWGLVDGVAADQDKGHVWLTESHPHPEMEKLLTDEAREKLATLGLSMDGSLRLKARADAPGEYECTWLEVTDIDIVDRGAFGGSGIVPLIPAELAASLAARAAGLQQQRRPAPGTRPLNAKDGDSMDEPPATPPAAEIPPELLQAYPELAQLSPDQAAAYIAAYTEAVNAGQPPEAAHQLAIQRATAPPTPAPAPAPIGAKGGKGESTQTERHTMELDPKEVASLRAKASKADDLEKEVGSLKAKLAEQDTEKNTLAARFTTLEGSVKELAAKNADLVAEREDRAAREDVTWAIVQARKATPAEEPSLMKIRKAVGTTDFRAMISAREATTVPVGEMGGQPHDAGKATADQKAAADVAKYGVEGIFNAGLHMEGVEGSDALRAHLAAKHASHPQVRKHLARELKVLAKATGGGA